MPKYVFLIFENARYVWFTECDDSLLPRISTISQLAKHVQQHTKPKLHSMPTKHPPNPPLPKKPTKSKIKLTRGKSKSRVVGLAGLGGGSKAGVVV